VFVVDTPRVLWPPPTEHAGITKQKKDHLNAAVKSIAASEACIRIESCACERYRSPALAASPWERCVPCRLVPDEWLRNTLSGGYNELLRYKAPTQPLQEDSPAPAIADTTCRSRFDRGAETAISKLATETPTTCTCSLLLVLPRDPSLGFVLRLFPSVVLLYFRPLSAGAWECGPRGYLST